MKMKEILYRIVFVLSAFSFGCLVGLPIVLELGFSCICFIIVALLITTKRYLEEHRKPGLLYDLVLLSLVVQDFVVRWLPSSMISKIISQCPLPKEHFLLILAIILAITSLLFVDKSIYLFRQILKKQFFRGKIGSIIYILPISFLQFLSIEYSSRGSLSEILGRSIDVILSNIVLILIINIIAVLFIRRWNVSLSIVSCLFALWSIANYYTIKFHGSPLFFSEFPNIGTAVSVVFNYKYQISFQIIAIILLLLAEVYICSRSFAFFREKKTHQGYFLSYGIVLVLLVIAFLPCYKNAIKKDRPWMPWNISIEKCGFLLCTVEDAEERANPIIMPDGYREEALPQVSDDLKGRDQDDYPDIILILNESFCDIKQFCDLSSDKEALLDFYNIEEAYYGYAVVPNIGGGTNDSEFELLTGKSMYLLRSMAPFTYLNNMCLERSAVQYLKSFNYETCAMHCAGAQNYSRDQAYPLIGFSSSALGPEFFSHTNSNGNRTWLDSENYLDLVEQYKRMGNGPRLLFLLTFQNHGGYEQNAEAFDTIHISNHLDGLTDDVEEYLSSVELSAKAFRDLVGYYEQEERRVIICMVGDHAPSFISELPHKQSMSFEELEIAKRIVPYVIWSNYGVEMASYTDYVSMVDVLPIVMQTAGVPLSTFYQRIIDLHEEVPIRTSNGIYMDREGNMGTYSAEDGPDLISQYYYLEYNSFLPSDRYKKELFEYAS